MTANQARTIVAQHLVKLKVQYKLVAAIIDMTRDECIEEAANIVQASPNITFDDIKLFVYVPEID